MMKIIMGCDHGGFELKETLKKVLIEKGYEVEDYGIHKQERVDYPDYAQKVGEAIASGKGDQRHPHLRHGNRHEHCGQ